MRRREFISFLGSAATAWPLGVNAQQLAMPVVGFLRSTSLVEFPHLITAFRQRLNEAGFIEGQNIAIEFRSAEDRHDRLSGLAADLLRRPVDVPCVGGELWV
jgi:putative tryptophan/tyrosine transport system substrate-binding protein